MIEEEIKYNTYTIQYKRGIDDLLSEYAFIGNSQGDTSRTNNIEEYVNSKGWLSFIFEGIDPIDQEAINLEVHRRVLHNLHYIDELKREGRYEEPYEVTLQLVYNPLFDDPNINILP